MAKIQNPPGLPILFQLLPHLPDGGIFELRQLPSRFGDYSGMNFRQKNRHG
jgi:hypothetical protein